MLRPPGPGLACCTSTASTPGTAGTWTTATPTASAWSCAPNSASILWNQSAYSFRDQEWRSRPINWRDGPLNIYEVHLGSWKRKPDRGWYTYRELARPLISYAKDMGYNALEFLPLSEHPSDASWGYQITGFFSPTSRYGTPDDLKYLVDQCHQAGLAVFLDFVPAHFAVDDYGLWNYDGTALYQYPSPDVGNSAWGSCSFMHSRGEVRSFLNSAAHFWLKEYHFDGLRVDAVRNLIYWNGEPARGENQGGLQFLRAMNRGLKERCPHALLIAEDSSAYPGVTRPAEEGGLGFDLKWDLGWMHDTLSYFQAPPEERAGQGGKLSFSMDYFANERYLLPFVPRRSGPRQSHYFTEDARGLCREISPSPGPLPLHARPSGEEAELYGQRAGPFPGVGRGPGTGLEPAGLPLASGIFGLSQGAEPLLPHRPRPVAGWGDGVLYLAAAGGRTACLPFLREGNGQRLLAVFNFLDREQDLSLFLNGATRLQLMLDSDSAAFGGSAQEKPEVPAAKYSGLRLTLPPYSGRLYQVE